MFETSLSTSLIWDPPGHHLPDVEQGEGGERGSTPAAGMPR